MFDFMDMLGNHDDRMVGRYETDDLFVDTCLVTDVEDPYETAVGHVEYNNGKLIIVETYKTESEAKAGHDRWVDTMLQDNLPESLTDVSKAAVIVFGRAMFGDDFLRDSPREPAEWEAPDVS